ncbi:unnamed protein product [Rhizophagus irregularis]|nr:unnamed protein product [Rhizophagus irregularis]
MEQCWDANPLKRPAFYISRSYDFSLSSNYNDSKESPRLSKKLKIENDVQNDYEREFMQRQSNISINDEVQNNPNLHSDEKDKQETPNDEF